MKVIALGRKIKGTMRVSCGKCDSVLEIEIEDLTKESDFQNDYSYVCPCCNRKQHIEWNELSPDLRWELNYNH